MSLFCFLLKHLFPFGEDHCFLRRKFITTKLDTKIKLVHLRSESGLRSESLCEVKHEYKGLCNSSSRPNTYESLFGLEVNELNEPVGKSTYLCLLVPEVLRSMPENQRTITLLTIVS